MIGTLFQANIAGEYLITGAEPRLSFWIFRQPQLPIFCVIAEIRSSGAILIPKFHCVRRIANCFGRKQFPLDILIPKMGFWGVVVGFWSFVPEVGGGTYRLQFSWILLGFWGIWRRFLGWSGLGFWRAELRIGWGAGGRSGEFFRAAWLRGLLD